MIDLWAKYNFERWGVKTLIEDDKGFVNYTINAPLATIEDIYVVPEYRSSGVASGLADMVCALAKKAGCEEIKTQVWVSAKGAEVSLAAHLAYGFKLISADGGRIMLAKDLKG